MKITYLLQYKSLCINVQILYFSQIRDLIADGPDGAEKHKDLIEVRKRLLGEFIFFGWIFYLDIDR